MSDARKARKPGPKAKRDGETPRRPRVMRLGEKVEALMQIRGLSAADVTRKTKIPASRISEWGRGEGEGSQSPLVFLKLARALDVTADFLLDDAQDTYKPALNEDEAKILELVRDMGPQVARRRLLQLDDADGRSSRDAHQGESPDPTRPTKGKNQVG